MSSLGVIRLRSDRIKDGMMQAANIAQDTALVMVLSDSLSFSSRKTLRAMIDRGLARGQRDFVLDLHNVTFIDSSGLGALVACFSTVRKQGGSMKLARVPRMVYELMEMTKLTQFFDICDNWEFSPGNDEE